MRALRGSRGHEGAAAVEFALLFPIFMILALGIINGGLAFSRQINVTQAAREASRFGATLTIAASAPGGAGTLSTWLAAVDNAVTTASGHAANPIGGYDYRCVALVVRTPVGAIDAAKSGYSENGGGLVAGGGCPSVSTPNFGINSRFVQVVLSRDITFFVLFLSPKLHLDAVSNSPYEGALA